MAKRISSRIADGAVAAAPLLFDPNGLYSDREIAARAKVHPRTAKRWLKQWRSEGGAGQFQFTSNTTRTLGAELNRMCQARLK